MRQLGCVWGGRGEGREGMDRVRGEMDIKRKSWKKLHLIDDKDARTIRTADSGRLLGLESPVSTMSP